MLEQKQLKQQKQPKQRYPYFRTSKHDSPMTPSVLLFLASLCALVFAAIVYIILQRYLKHREREWTFILKQDNNKAIAPLRITACERCVVMLERITPTSLVMRHNMRGASAAMLQLELIKSIREEFEHNVSLQIYVGPECWEKIRRAKDETIELIKVAFTRVNPESNAIELSGEIFKLEASVGNSAIRDAITGVRVEMARHF